MSGIHVSRRHAITAAVSTGLAVAAIFLPWSASTAVCPNVQVTRAFAEAIDPVEWSWIYLLAFTGVLGATLVPGRAGRGLAVLSAVAALVATGAMLADVSEPFEAIRPRPGLPPVGVLCTMEPAEGAWLALAAVAIAIGLGWGRAGVHPAWSSRRFAGAVGTGLVNVMVSWIWIVVFVDAAVDTTSDHPTDGGIAIASMTLVVAAAVAAWLVWPTVGGRAMAAHGLLVVGTFALTGPVLLLALRMAGIGRQGAAVLASWDGPYAILGPIFIGGIAVLGALGVTAGLAMTRRERVRTHP